MKEYGWNNETHIFCGFCAWVRPIKTDEQAELYLREHLRVAHNKPLYFRRVDATGEIVDIPY
jgi:hypothetical protein